MVKFDTLHEVPGELNENPTVHPLSSMYLAGTAMDSKHEVDDSESSENIIDAIKAASHYKSGSQGEKFMDVNQHLHPNPLSSTRDV